MRQQVGTMFSGKELRKLIIPLILEQALAITVGMVDTMMVSSVGEAAVSGVSLVDMLNNLLFNIMAALSTGGAVVASQYLGASQKKEARNAAKQLIVTALGLSVLLMIAIILCRVTVLRL